MIDAVRLLSALAFAAEKHRHQRRKDSQASPYINHPIAVATVLANAGVGDEKVLIAAILHDTVEDTETTPDELEQFGPEVRKLVAEVTDDESLPKQVRKSFRSPTRGSRVPGRSRSRSRTRSATSRTSRAARRATGR